MAASNTCSSSRSRRPRTHLTLVDNPPWVTKAVVDSYELIEQKVPGQMLPLLSDVRARRGALVGQMPELGCGAYGCVLATLSPGVVIKVTTDDTESEFAAKLSPDLVVPVVVKYHLVIALRERHKGRKIHLLWRESAQHVGKMDEILGARAVDLVDEQHIIAQKIYEVLFNKGDMNEALAMIDKWLALLDGMAKQTDVPELQYFGAGLAKVYREQKIFFGDLHAGNLGLVSRAGGNKWVVTDPGHVAVVA
jgi:hypothetical protein